MSNMRDLLEKMNTFAGKQVGQKPGDQVRGSEPMPKKGGGKKHPYAGRLVGASESSDNLLKELTQVINSDPVKRDLFQEWAEYKEGFDDTVKSAADKIVAAGSATRDALGSVVSTIPSIPRPFDEKEVAKDLSKVQSTQPKTSWRNTDKKMQEGGGTTARIRTLRDPDDPDNYDKIRFQQQKPDRSIVDIEPYSGSHNSFYRQVTGKEPGQSPTSRAMTDTLNDLMSKPSTPGKTIPEPKELYPQDVIRQPAKPVDDEEDDIVAEWGAAGTAVGPGNDDADPVEIAAQRAQQVAGKQDQQNQVAGLIAQVNGARSELAGLNKQFPQGANPVEKAMSLQQMQGQRVALGRQIEDLMSQVASLRSQA